VVAGRPEDVAGDAAGEHRLQRSEDQVLTHRSGDVELQRRRSHITVDLTRDVDLAHGSRQIAVDLTRDVHLACRGRHAAADVAHNIHLPGDGEQVSGHRALDAHVAAGRVEVAVDDFSHGDRICWPLRSSGCGPICCAQADEAVSATQNPTTIDAATCSPPGSGCVIAHDSLPSVAARSAPPSTSTLPSRTASPLRACTSVPLSCVPQRR
jgi:hypothetical protein